MVAVINLNLLVDYMIVGGLFAIGAMKLMRFPLWLIVPILAVGAGIPIVAVVHHDNPGAPEWKYVAACSGAAAGVILLIPWLYAIGRMLAPLQRRLLLMPGLTQFGVRPKWLRESTTNKAVEVPKPPVPARRIVQQRISPRPAATQRSVLGMRAVNVPQLFADAVTVAIREDRWAFVPPFVALACGWTFVWVALWYAAVGAVIGFLLGFGIGSGVGSQLDPASWTSIGLLAAVAGAAVGAALLFVTIYAAQGVVGVAAFLTSMATGLVISTLIAMVTVQLEPMSMKMRGYRRLSDRELKRAQPVIDDVCTAMHVTQRPTFLVHDVMVPGAWTHCHHIVLTKRSLDLDQAQLSALIAHEMSHYLSGDGVFSVLVWACALPVAVVANLQSVSQRGLGPFLGFLTALVFWPALLLLRFVIGPALAGWSRTVEYRADAAAAEAGFGSGLIQLLDLIKVFEPARSGWSTVIAATHPPTELRIEALLRRSMGTEAEEESAPFLPQPAI
jgi:Zn-dependent protease with chaperone function